MKYIITAYSRDCDGVDVYMFTGTEKQMMEKVKAYALDAANEDGGEEVNFGWDNFAYPSYTAHLINEDCSKLIEAREWKYANRKLNTSRKSLYQAKKLEDEGWVSVDSNDSDY